MKYENNLHIFSERIISRMKKENLFTKKGKPDIIALYNKLYPNDIITDELIKQDRQKVTDKTRSVSDWIKGKYYPRSIKDIMDLCNILNCSIDYLFDYNECSQHDIQFIHDETGLSEDAIKQLNFLYHSIPDEFRNNVASLSYLLEYIPFSETLLQNITIYLFKYWDYKKGEELNKYEKEKRNQRSETEQLMLEMSGYKPSMTAAELGKLKELEDVALFHATTTFSSVLTNIAEILYKNFQKGEKPTLINQLQGGCLYFDLPQSKK